MEIKKDSIIHNSVQGIGGAYRLAYLGQVIDYSEEEGLVYLFPAILGYRLKHQKEFTFKNISTPLTEHTSENLRLVDEDKFDLYLDVLSTPPITKEEFNKILGNELTNPLDLIEEDEDAEYG